MSTVRSASADHRDMTPEHCIGEPGHASYIDSTMPTSLMYLSCSSAGPYLDMENRILLPVFANNLSKCISVESTNMTTSLADEAITYSTMKGGRNEMFLMKTVGTSVRGEEIIGPEDQQMSLRPQFSVLNGHDISLQHPTLSAFQSQGLSLSLSTQITLPSLKYQPTGSDISFIEPHQTSAGNGGSHGDESLRNKSTHGNLYTYGFLNWTSSVPNSKYLKATQELLDEVINVQATLKRKPDKFRDPTTCKEASGGSESEGVPSDPQESIANSSSELSPYERQDLQNKVMKLLEMLEEVDKRYKQYDHRMQIIVLSFDEIAGRGSSKPYTALALPTISRHFRCLRDAISSQIQAARKSLGEPDNSNRKAGGLSRLRCIDQQVRQQRATQQFGMMNHQAWRPQRGLPESSVSILRAWLFEHFLHPYPKDSEKLMLARQTGLTRSQVSNWFINARVRLWKPMIEDMYKQETGDAEIDSNCSSENTPPVVVGREDGQSLKDLQSPTAERCQAIQINEPPSNPESLSAINMPGSAPGFQEDLKLVHEGRIGQDSSFLQRALAPEYANGRFMAYQMAELGRYSNGGVSLTLGLQHFSGGGGLPFPCNPQDFIGARENGMYGAAPPVGADTAGYDYVSAAPQRPRYVPPPHMLHDFVA